MLAKGQEISEWVYEVVALPKIWKKNLPWSFELGSHTKKETFLGRGATWVLPAVTSLTVYCVGFVQFDVSKYLRYLKCNDFKVHSDDRFLFYFYDSEVLNRRIEGPIPRLCPISCFPVFEVFEVCTSVLNLRFILMATFYFTSMILRS